MGASSSEPATAFSIAAGLDQLGRFAGVSQPLRSDHADLSQVAAQSAEQLCVRCEINISRVLCRINAAWFSSERTPTNRIEGRITASQIAAASDASFFCRRI
jgi:hypothetical protein